MEQSRYRDKKYLITYELTTDIFEAYNLKIDEIVPIQSEYLLYTNRGLKILKKIPYKISELQYINFLINYIKEHGYEHIIPFLKTKEDKFYIIKNSSCYVILDLVEGREADFREDKDLGIVAASLCKFHNSTKGIPYSINERDNLFKWVYEFQKRIDDLYKFKEIAEFHENKSEFDIAFLSYFDLFIKDAIIALNMLKKSNYNSLCEKDKALINICNHNLKYNNIIIDNKNNIYFVDFDNFIIDLRIHDIANFIINTVKNFNFDIKKANIILNSYQAIEQLSKDEIDVLYCFLTFPQEYYDAGRYYYMKTRCWEEEDFLMKLRQKIETYYERVNFLNEIKKL